MNIGALNVRIVAEDQLTKSLSQMTATTQRFAQQLERTSAPVKKLTGEMGVLGGAAKALAGYFSGRALWGGLMASFEAADALEASNRRLSSAALLAGQNLGFLQKTSRDAADTFGLSTRTANQYTEALIKLTGKAGQVERTGEAIGALLNLSAARGLGTEEALNAIEMAILGIDNGTDKLFGKNPSVIFQEFAASIGTTGTKLDDTQKAFALLNELTGTGGKVMGAYAEYLNSAAGQSEQLRKKTEETAAGIGRSMYQMRAATLPVLSDMVGGFAKFVQAGQRMGIESNRFFGEIGVDARLMAAKTLQGLAEMSLAFSNWIREISGGRVSIGAGLAESLFIQSAKVESNALALGGRIGKRYVEGVERITAAYNLTPPIEGSTDAINKLLDGLTDKAGKAGKKAGKSFVDSLSEAVGAATGLADVFKERGLDAPTELASVLTKAYDTAAGALAKMGSAITADRLALEKLIDTLKGYGPVATKVLSTRTAPAASTQLATAAAPQIQAMSVATKRWIDTVMMGGGVITLATEVYRENKAAIFAHSQALQKSVEQIRTQFANPGQTSRRALQMLADSALGVAQRFSPLGLASEALGGLMDTLAPALNALLMPVRMVGQVMGMLIMPVMKALFPVFKFAGIAATYLGQVLANVAGGVAKALGGLIYAVGVAVKLLPGDRGLGERIKSAGKGIQRFGDEMFGVAGDMKRARDELKGLSWEDALEPVRDAANKTAAALLNVPSGFRVFNANNARFNATAAPIPAPPHSGGGTVLAPPQTVNVNPFPVNIYLDKEKFMEVMVDYQERQSLAEYGTRQRGLR